MTIPPDAFSPWRPNEALGCPWFREPGHLRPGDGRNSQQAFAVLSTPIEIAAQVCYHFAKFMKSSLVRFWVALGEQRWLGW